MGQCGIPHSMVTVQTVPETRRTLHWNGVTATANATALASEVWDASARALRALRAFGGRVPTIFYVPATPPARIPSVLKTPRPRLVTRNDLEWEVKPLEPDAVGLDQSPHQTVINTGPIQRGLCVESRHSHGYSPFALTGQNRAIIS